MKKETGFRLYVGNMFGGKTAKMIFDLQRAEYAGKKVQAFKISWDNRTGENNLTANNGQLKYPAVSVLSLSALKVFLKSDTEILAIDELQFWEEDILDFIKEYQHKIKIIGTGLQFDYRREPFSLRKKKGRQFDSENVSIVDLMGISTEIYQEWPVCTKKDFEGKVCGKTAHYPQRWRKDGTLSSFSDNTIVVGGEEKYAPRCSSCYIKPKQ